MKISNATYVGANERLGLIDLEVPRNFNGKMIVFLHGFMGFKDWGAWSLVQDYFVDQGYGFCKFNTTHNGGTAQNGIDFPDPDAFGKNTYSKEIFDVKSVLDWLNNQIDHCAVHMIGHSKGGAVSLICGSRFNQITSISTWASIASIDGRFPKEEALDTWKKKGVRHIKNGRTMQELPQYICLYEDYLEHREAYHIESICRNQLKPLFIAHGEKDTSVSIDHGIQLAKWSGMKLQVIPNANHVFESKHPWTCDELPPALHELCSLTADFIHKI